MSSASSLTRERRPRVRGRRVAKFHGAVWLFISILVRNRAAFEARYGLGRPIAGEYSGQFNNAGERVTVVNGNGATIIDFAYGTILPWPTTPDGSGVSLEVINPKGNLNMPFNWHPSVVMGGSPGLSNPVPAPALELEASDPSLLRLWFNGRGGSRYTVYSRGSLSIGSWQVFQQVPQLIDDQPVEIRVPLTNTPSSRFFRVSTP